jgi:hypothetical protein
VADLKRRASIRQKNLERNQLLEIVSFPCSENKRRSSGCPLFPSATVVDAKDGNTVSIVLDKATPNPGQEVPLIGIVAAVAAPPDDLSGDPFYQMNHSAEPTQRTGNATASVASSGAAAQTAILKGKNDPKSNLQEDSSGAIGIEGLKLNWVLDKPPATTMLTTKKKNFKLVSGTEFLLRMAPPQM